MLQAFLHDFLAFVSTEGLSISNNFWWFVGDLDTRKLIFKRSKHQYNENLKMCIVLLIQFPNEILNFRSLCTYKYTVLSVF